MQITRCRFKEQLEDTWKVVFDSILIAAALLLAYYLGGSDTAQGMFAGAVVGVALHWRATAKASVCISNNLVPFAKAWSESRGYIRSDDGKEYIPRIHRLLRFDSQNIRFARNDESSMMMLGPYYMLERFSRSI